MLDIALKSFTFCFNQTEDTFLLEYTSAVLNRFAANSPHHLDKIIESPVLPKVLAQVKLGHDPDVLLHSLQLLDQFTATPLGLASICDTYCIDHLLDALCSEYLTVQSAALEALVNLTGSKNPSIMRSLERPAIMDKVFDILEVDLQDYHESIKTNKIINLFTE